MLQVQNITKIFNPSSVNERVALSDVSLEVSEGDFITVIGGNGAGKTTLLNIVAGVYMVDCGQIIINGCNVTCLPDYARAADISRIFQDPMLGTAGSMTVEENLSLAIRRGQKRILRPGLSDKRRSFFRDKLTLLGLGLETRLTTPVNLLSGGQRQALSLLMATLIPPRLVLLDEHTASLDPKTGVKVMELTRKLVEEQNITTLMVTHNMEQALKVGKRTIMMHEGKIILDLQGEEREQMTIPRLVDLFHEASGEQLQSDRILLA
jgi:putative tryptophan/tyrosine transport system ATP-binding protein